MVGWDYDSHLRPAQRMSRQILSFRTLDAALCQHPWTVMSKKQLTPFHDIFIYVFYYHYSIKVNVVNV